MLVLWVTFIAVAEFFSALDEEYGPLDVHSRLSAIVRYFLMALERLQELHQKTTWCGPKYQRGPWSPCHRGHELPRLMLIFKYLFHNSTFHPMHIWSSRVSTLQFPHRDVIKMPHYIKNVLTTRLAAFLIGELWSIVKIIFFQIVHFLPKLMVIFQSCCFGLL